MNAGHKSDQKTLWTGESIRKEHVILTFFPVLNVTSAFDTLAFSSSAIVFSVIYRYAHCILTYIIFSYSTIQVSLLTCLYPQQNNII